MIAVALPPEAVEELIELVAERVVARLRQEQNGGSPWLTVREAAEYVHLPVGRLYKLTAADAVPHRRVGARILLHRAELDSWLVGERP
jgi:excisionase family DNA binding protein